MTFISDPAPTVFSRMCTAVAINNLIALILQCLGKIKAAISKKNVKELKTENIEKNATSCRQ